MLIERPLYLQKLQEFVDKPIIKVITGMRRAGKSSLLMTFAEKLKNNGVKPNHLIQINLEDLKYDGLDYKGLNDLILAQLPDDTEKVYVFLDEIGRVSSWEKTINSLQLNNRLDIYLTGSNAYMLSTELSTYLSGRYVEIKMFPLSFQEFLRFYTPKEQKTETQMLAQYIKLGGMPSLVDYDFQESQSPKVLDGICNTVLVKDIIERSPSKDLTLLNRLIRFLVDNVGNITSINKITGVLVNSKDLSYQNNKLIKNYIHLLENAFIFYSVNRYDIKGKELLRSLNKYYIVDSGLRHYLLGHTDDTGRILENIVYMELLRRDYQVYIGKIGTQEVDFIAIKGEEKIYIQVSQTLADEKTKERELSPLQQIPDNFTKMVLTTDELFTGISKDGIKIVNLIDWLLER